MSTASEPAFPRLRWAGLAFLAVWAPSYALAYPLANFLFLCDIAVVLTVVGLWRGSALLLSSQAVGSLVIDLTWDLDLAWRLMTGGHLLGGTEYMFQASIPLGVRLLSLFHVAWPPLLVYALRRVGYDRRGFALETAIAAAAIVAARFVMPEANINGAYRDPLFQRSWGPAPVHLAVVIAGGAGLLFWPTHLVLARLLKRA